MMFSKCDDLHFQENQQKENISHQRFTKPIKA